jgi:asparagine synthetase B (glutamine-hydrolysing)
VLSLRGGGGNNKQVTQQPLVDPTNGNILLWNGEIFASSLVPVNADENDGQNLLFKLGETSDLLSVFESIKGPYAFVFYEKKTNFVYFGRDRLGRRSLLISLNKEKSSLSLTSVKIKLNKSSSPVAELNSFEELKANGIYRFSLEKIKSHFLDDLTLFEWRKKHETNDPSFRVEEQLNYLSHVKLSDEKRLNDSIEPFNEVISIEEESANREQDFEKTVDEFYSRLKESVSRRVKNIPDYCKQCANNNFRSNQLGTVKFNTDLDSVTKCNHAKLGIFEVFGLDIFLIDLKR